MCRTELVCECYGRQVVEFVATLCFCTLLPTPANFLPLESCTKLFPSSQPPSPRKYGQWVYIGIVAYMCTLHSSSCMFVYAMKPIIKLRFSDLDPDTCFSSQGVELRSRPRLIHNGNTTGCYLIFLIQLFIMQNPYTLVIGLV